MKSLGNIFILGDSYSTFEGYIPEGYSAYYGKKGPSYKKDVYGENDVLRVEDTWWYTLAKERGELCLNCSYSGSTICNTGYGGADFSGFSFITRLDKLISGGFFKENKIDTFFLFGGTNDSWANAPIGELMYDGWTQDDLYNALPAFGYIMETIKKKLSGIKVYFIMNTELKEEITSAYEMACEKYNVRVIKLSNIEKFEGHPTVFGMRQIKEQILNYIDFKETKHK